MIRVAAIQCKPSLNRVDTLRRVGELIEQAAHSGVNLVCLPEAFTGIYGVDQFAHNAENWKGPNSGSELMATMADKHKMYICGGIIERDEAIEGRLFNTIAAFGPQGNEVARYRKVHLSRVAVGGDVTCEGDVLTAGEDIGCFDIDLSLCGSASSSHNRSHDISSSTSANGSASGSGGASDTWRVGLACCFDLRFPRLTNMLTHPPPRGLGCDMLLYPSAWLASTGKLGHWDSLLRARALDGQVFVVGANQARRAEGRGGGGAEQGPVLFGHSTLLGPLGEVLSTCVDDMGDEVIVADFSRRHLEQIRGVKINLSAAKRSEESYTAMFKKAVVDVATRRQQQQQQS